MSVFINGSSCISPQSTFGKVDFLENPVAHDGSFLTCLQPESYKEFINPMRSRRMSRAVKMGIATAISSLRQGNIEKPDSILVGTGLGCLEDTEKQRVCIRRLWLILSAILPY